jgi:hypothetical protein
MKEIPAKHKWWENSGCNFRRFYNLHIVLRSAGDFSQFTFRTIQTVDGHFQLTNRLGIRVGIADSVISPGWATDIQLRGSNLARNLLLHLGFGVVFASIHRVLYIILVQMVAPNALTIPNSELPRVFYFLHFISESFLDYLFILAVLQAIMYYREFHERESRLQQAELQTLKTQLHPHFLFNTLNAISALVYSNPKMADRTIAQLSHLLRLSVKSGKTQEVSLKEELDFLRKYVEIQQTLSAGAPASRMEY